MTRTSMKVKTNGAFINRDELENYLHLRSFRLKVRCKSFTVILAYIGETSMDKLEAT